MRFLVNSRILICCGLLAAFGSTAHAAGISASGTFTGTPDWMTPGVTDYSIKLSDTGTTTIGTFWFAWVPGAGFLSAAPTNVGSPAGWTEKTTNSNGAIQWTTTTALMNPGDVLGGFTFDSTEAPWQLLANFSGTGKGAGDADTTSFAYIGAPFNDPGVQFTVSPAPTPEPGTVILTLTGLAAITCSMKRGLISL